MKVAVIGAGPSGLTTLKYLLTAHESLPVSPIEARLFETEAEIGGTFRHRTYEDAELVSSKQLTTFSDLRPRDSDPDFLPSGRYVEYLDDYVTKFGLRPHIHLSSPVLNVRRHNSGHEITYRNGKDGGEEVWDCDAIAVCSGLHVTPAIPVIPGIEHVPQVFHASDFKSRADFGVDKTVLILGSGETGMDVAYMAVTGKAKTKRVLMSHRDGFLCAPKRVPDPVILPILGNKPDPTHLNVPVDSSSASLFDTAYVHPLLRDHTILWEYYDLFIKSTLWLVSGTSHGLDQWIGGISPQRYHASKIFFNKSNKAMPYISAPWKEGPSSTLVQRIRTNLIQVPLADTHGRQIDLAPWPAYFDENGVVHFRDNGRPEYDRLKDEKIKPDLVIYCTGYTQSFPFFSSNPDPATNGVNGTTHIDTNPYPTTATTNVRDIWRRSDPTIAFIGFVRPSFGAIPPLSELQAQLWITNLLAPQLLPAKGLFLPADEPHYRLLSPPNSRITYGVDHESYAYQLALDMGSAPTFGEVMKLGWASSKKTGRPWWRLPLVWALGANFNAKFRLKGPWRWDGAEDVLTGELWDTIERRGGFFGHVTLSGLPMLIFGSISLMLYIYTTLLKLVGIDLLYRRAQAGMDQMDIDEIAWQTNGSTKAATITNGNGANPPIANGMTNGSENPQMSGSNGHTTG